MTPFTKDFLEGLRKELLEGRDPGDTHDYSSSGYNGFDDGYITGVNDVILRIEEALGL